jgi:hypothetical protein
VGSDQSSKDGALPASQPVFQRADHQFEFEFERLEKQTIPATARFEDRYSLAQTTQVDPQFLDNGHQIQHPISLNTLFPHGTAQLIGYQSLPFAIHLVVRGLLQPEN